MSVELISVLIAVVAVGITLAGLMLSGQRAIRTELAEQRRELAAQRREFSAELAAQRQEFSAELAAQRREFNERPWSSTLPPWSSTLLPWSSRLPNCVSVWPIWKDCWMGCARPSPSRAGPPDTKAEHPPRPFDTLRATPPRRDFCGAWRVLGAGRDETGQ